MCSNNSTLRWKKPEPIKLVKAGKNQPKPQVLAEQVVQYGLTHQMTQWIKAQHAVEAALDMTGLSQGDVEHIKSSKTHGCTFPPCRDYLPTIDTLVATAKDVVITPTNQDLEIIDACLKIAACSSSPWARHQSSLKQATFLQAMGFLAHYHKKSTRLI